MNRTEAQEFFRDHAEWLANSWGMTPEGREYKARFDAAVDAIQNQTTKPGELTCAETADYSEESWEKDCANILREPERSWEAPNYIRAIKFTREVFRCDLKQGKDRVDCLRQRLCL